MMSRYQLPQIKHTYTTYIINFAYRTTGKSFFQFLDVFLDLRKFKCTFESIRVYTNRKLKIEQVNQNEYNDQKVKFEFKCLHHMVWFDNFVKMCCIVGEEYSFKEQKTKKESYSSHSSKFPLILNSFRRTSSPRMRVQALTKWRAQSYV